MNFNKKLIISAIVIFVLFVLSLYFFQFHGGLSNDHTKWGTFGDYLGGIFAFLAFLAVLYTINVQIEQLKVSRDELKLTREEMKLSRKEMKNSVLALQSQNKTLMHRNFESTYFELIKMRSNVLLGVRCNVRGTLSKGIDATRQFYKSYTIVFSEPKYNIDNAEEKITVSFNNTVSAYMKGIEDYFRFIKSIFKFIDSSDITNKNYYSDLLISLLSQSEQLILLYGSVANYSNIGLKEFFIKYNTFQNLELKNLIDNAHLDLLS